MKGFIAALILFALVISGLFAFNLYITKTFDTLLSDFESVENAIVSEDFDKGKEYFNKFNKRFVESSPVLSLFLDRSPIDNALTELAKAGGFICEEDSAEALSTLAGLEVILIRIVEKSLLKIENIL